MRLKRSMKFIIPIVLVTSISIFVINGFFFSGKDGQKIRKAAIIDGLSSEFPNKPFTLEARELLEKAGYRVDVFNESSVTVKFYGDLASKGYGFIILRVHSAPMDGGEIPGAALFTSEKVNSFGYAVEQFAGWVKIARPLTNDERFYAVTPDYIEERMEGKFENTVIILMSCFGLSDETLAKIFIGKGASSFIGWTERVTTWHMDQATLLILRKVVNEKISVTDAVDMTRNEVGADPVYGGELKYFVAEST